MQCGKAPTLRTGWRADFIHKLAVAAKELRETIY
jgi:hypothetical protein